MAIPKETLQVMRTQFQNSVRSDSVLGRIRKRIQNGGQYSDAEQYGIRTGQLLSKTFQENITADLFDDDEPLDAGNLASAIIPMMEQNYNLVSAATASVQKTRNLAGNIGINPIVPEFDSKPAMNIIGRMVNNYDSFEDASWLLGEPIVSESLNTVDKTLHSNADFQYKSGLKPKIVRTAEPDACEWCQDLEGEYDYEEIKDRNNPVYQRHNNCQCEITFEPGDGRVQDVYSKQWYDEEKAAERISQSKKEEIEYLNTKSVKSEELQQFNSQLILNMATDNDRGQKMEPLTARGISLPEEISSVIKKTEKSGDYAVVNDFANKDLCVLTRETGVEYSKISIGEEVYVIRGEETGLTIPDDIIDLLSQSGGRFDAHCHPFVGDVIPSRADIQAIEKLEAITGQKTSEIYSVDGMHSTYSKHGIIQVTTSSDENVLSEKDKRMLEKLFGEE